MKPAEIRERIVSLQENLRITDIMIREILQHLDDRYYNRKVKAYTKVIEEAQAQLDKLHDTRQNAIMQIGEIERNQRHNKRTLAKLIHRRKVEQLLKLAEALRKETTDGEEPSDTKA